MGAYLQRPSPALQRPFSVDLPSSHPLSLMDSAAANAAAAAADHLMAYDLDRNRGSRRPDDLEEQQPQQQQQQQQQQMIFNDPQWGGPRTGVNVSLGVDAGAGAGARARSRPMPAVGPPWIDPLVTSSVHPFGDHGGYYGLNVQTAPDDNNNSNHHEGALDVDAAGAIAGRLEPTGSWGSSLRSSVSVPDGYESLQSPIFPRRSHAAADERKIRSEPTTPESMHETIQARLNAMASGGDDARRAWTAGETIDERTTAAEGPPSHQALHEEPVPPAWSRLKTKAGKQRRRLPLACFACRQKKVRCSGEMPSCKHCLRWRISCVYKTRTQKAPPRKVTKSAAEDRSQRSESGKGATSKKSKDAPASGATTVEMGTSIDAVNQPEQPFHHQHQQQQQQQPHQPLHQPHPEPETAPTGGGEGHAKRDSESSVDGGVPLSSSRPPGLDPVYLASSEAASRRPSLANLDQPPGISLQSALNLWQGQPMSVLSPSELASQSRCVRENAAVVMGRFERQLTERRDGNVQPVLILAVMPVQTDGKGAASQLSGPSRSVQELDTPMPTPCKVEQDPFDRTETSAPPSQSFHPPMVIPPQMSSLNIFPPMAFPPSQLAEHEQATPQSTYPREGYHQQADGGMAFESTFHPPMIPPPQYHAPDMPLSEHFPSDVSLQPSSRPAESTFAYHPSVGYHPTTDPHMMLSPHLHPPMVLPSPQGPPDVDAMDREPKSGLVEAAETSGGRASYPEHTSMPAGPGPSVGHSYGDYGVAPGGFYDPFSNVGFLASTTAPQTSTFPWGVDLTTTTCSGDAGLLERTIPAWPGSNEFGGGSVDHRSYH